MRTSRSSLKRAGIIAALACLPLDAARAAAEPGAERVFAAFEQVRERYRPSEGVVLDRHGQVLDRGRTNPRVRRLDWTRLDELSPAFRRALILSEDRRFHEHGGVDWLALGKAALQLSLRGESSRGASTLSMQLAGLIDPLARPEGGKRRSIPQKLKQMRSAWILEREWTKEQILEAYLNLVYFRGELQGVRAASEGLFGKAPHGLGLEESLLLAVLVRAPNAPPRLVGERACLLEPQSCDRLKALAEEALSSAYLIRRGDRQAAVLAARLGPGRASLHTTIDARIQRIAISALRRQVTDLRSRNVTDGAALVLDARTGEVLAYVPNIGAGSPAEFVDGIQASRQVGSTLKPFLYGMAIERRLLTPASLLEDSAEDFPVLGGVYSPKNHDHRFHGTVPLRVALGSSLNVPAVRVLGLVGVDSFVRKLKELGFKNLEEPEFYGPSLALGTADASLWELTNAYRALARDGLFAPARLERTDGPRGAPARVFSRETAFILKDILSDREARQLSFGLESPLATRFWSAVKTGTSKDMRDNWCIGFNERYVVGVWVGNFDGKPMHDVSGASGAAPAWVEILASLDRPARLGRRAPPAGVASERVHLPGASSARAELFLRGTEPASGSVRLAEKAGKIAYPPPDLMAAIDPDIPEERQRMLFQAEGNAVGHQWVFNGNPLGDASEPYAWKPTGGKHVLRLVRADGEIADEVRFEVR